MNNNIVVMDTLKTTQNNIRETKEDLATTNNKLTSVRNDFYNCFKNPFKNKWISIIGGLGTAFDYWTPPFNFTDSNTYPIGDVDNVNKTWWHILLTKLEANLCYNRARKDGRVNAPKDNEERFYNQMVKIGIPSGSEYKSLSGSTYTATSSDIIPDILLIMMGDEDFERGSGTSDMNNMLPEANGYATNDFMVGLNTLLHDMRIAYYPKVKVYIIGPYHTANVDFRTPNAVGLPLYAYHKMCENIANINGCHYIPMNKITQGRFDKNRYFLSSNSRIPNAAMQREMAIYIYNYMITHNQDYFLDDY